MVQKLSPQYCGYVVQFQSEYFDGEHCTISVIGGEHIPQQTTHQQTHAEFHWACITQFCVGKLWICGWRKSQNVYTTILKHSPSLQNFRWLLGSWRNENFCKSAYVSVSRPKMNIPVPVESKWVIVLGAWGCEWRGEFTMITGSDTMNTQTACSMEKSMKSIDQNWQSVWSFFTWNVQKTANRMTFRLLSSNCLSRPIFTIR